MTRKDIVEFGLTTNKKKEFHGFINQALKQAPKTRGRRKDPMRPPDIFSDKDLIHI